MEHQISPNSNHPKQTKGHENKENECELKKLLKVSLTFFVITNIRRYNKQYGYFTF